MCVRMCMCVCVCVVKKANNVASQLSPIPEWPHYILSL